MTLSRNLRRGGMHATTFLTSWTTSAPASRTTTVYWDGSGTRQTGVYISESGNRWTSRTTSAPASYWTSRTTSASGSYTTYWTTEWGVPYSYYSSYTTEWHSWAPGPRPYGHNTTVTYQWETSRYTYLKFSEEGWDTYFNTSYSSTFFVIDGYYNTDITHTAQTSALVSGSNHYSRGTSATVGYTTYYNTSWSVGYTSYWTTSWQVPYTTHYWNYFNTNYTTTYSSSYTTSYTSSWTTSQSTSRDTTW